VLAERFSLAIAYFNVSSQSGVKENGVTGLISYRF
jgi:hypothetical protein